MNNTHYPHTRAYLSPDGQASGRSEAVKQLQDAIGDSQDILATATTVFPFTLFPDTITIDRSKLTVTHRTFFMVGELFSIRIEDILSVTADIGPFFGSLKITDRFFENDAKKRPYAINYLWRHDALRLKRIIQGYIIATKKNIDCSPLKPAELTAMLEDLGKSIPTERV